MTRDRTPRLAGAPAHVGLQAGQRSLLGHVMVYLFVTLPFAALTVAVPWAWGWGLSWLDALLAGAWYTFTMIGITVGFHRYFTHGSFKVGRPIRIALAIAGSMAVQGSIMHWVADHRRHHAFADRDGDPHSPWKYGTSATALLRGIWHAHVGWLLDRNLTNEYRFAPDLLADRDMRVIHRLFGLLTVISMLMPPLVGGLITWSWHGALTAFFWASLVRLAFQQHVTWSVNSLCHLVGERPFAARDRSTNLWPLAILSFGDSWHNLHHADPTSARHGVDPWQVDISGRIIWLLETVGLAYDVRWPTPARLARMRSENGPRSTVFSGGTRFDLAAIWHGRERGTARTPRTEVPDLRASPDEPRDPCDPQARYLATRAGDYWRSLPEDLVKSESGHAKFLCGALGEEEQGVITYGHIESHSVEVPANTRVGFNRVSS